jgi:hypothetical protein
LVAEGTAVIAPTERNQPAGTRLFRRALVAILVASGVGVEAVDAQATIRGRVIDSELGDPLPGAVVRIRGTSDTLITDTLGRFEAVGLRPGEAAVNIELVGYTPGFFKVRLASSGGVDEVFPLDFSGHRLADVVVQARAEQLMPRYRDFEKRRQRGLGAYFRWDELKSKGYNSVGDALRTVRGVRIRCNQQRFECFATMVRTPQCQPRWWIDGMEVGSFHENTPIRDIYGIEIYRGPGEIPGEFSGSNAACGVIIMWTKSRPFR